MPSDRVTFKKDQSGKIYKQEIITKLNKIFDDCEKNYRSQVVMDKVKRCLEIGDFQNERNMVVNGILSEFDTLDPRSLAVIFDYKVNDYYQTREDFKNDLLQAKKDSQ